MSASRDELRQAYSVLLFQSLSVEQMLALGKRLDGRTLEPLGWDAVAPFVERIISTPEAAAGIFPYLLEAVLVLDRALRGQVYLGGAGSTVADVAIYLAARPAFAAMSAEQRWAVCDASRWCSHMEHQLHGHYDMVPADARVPKPLRILFDCDVPPGKHELTFTSPEGVVANVSGGVIPPTTARGVNATGEGRKDKGGDAKAAEPAAPPPPAVAAAAAAATSEGGGAGGAGGGGKKAKKEKAAAEPKKEAAAAAAAAAAATQSEISRLELRVGVVLEADKHPDADNLYVEKVMRLRHPSPHRPRAPSFPLSLSASYLHPLSARLPLSLSLSPFTPCQSRECTQSAPECTQVSECASQGSTPLRQPFVH
jgi:hypothetical protein